MFIISFIGAMLILLICAEILKRGEERQNKELQQSFWCNYTEAEIKKSKRYARIEEINNPEVYDHYNWNKIKFSRDQYKTMNSDFTISGIESYCYGSIGIENKEGPYRIHIEIFCNTVPKLRAEHYLYVTGISACNLVSNQVLACYSGLDKSMYDVSPVGCCLNKNGEIYIVHKNPGELETDFYYIEGYFYSNELPTFAIEESQCQQETKS